MSTPKDREIAYLIGLSIRATMCVFIAMIYMWVCDASKADAGIFGILSLIWLSMKDDQPDQ